MNFKELTDLTQLKENGFDLLDDRYIYYNKETTAYFELNDGIETRLNAKYKIGQIISFNQLHFRIVSCYPSYAFDHPEFYYKLLIFDYERYQTIPDQEQHYKKYYEKDLADKAIILSIE